MVDKNERYGKVALSRDEKGKEETEQMSKISQDKENIREQGRKGRPTLAEQLGRQRPRTGNLGSFFGITEAYKRKRKGEAEQESVRAEREFSDKIRKNRKVGRSPPLKKEEEA